MKITPYTRFDGIPTFRDSDLAHLFELMVRDGTAGMVFHDGTINSGTDFVRWVKSPGTMLFVAQEKVPLGCGWLNHFEQGAARCHFCVFAEGWSRAKEVCKAMIDSAFRVAGLEMLIGYIPVFNERAIRFCQACGGVYIGNFPFGSKNDSGNSHPTAVFYYVR